MTGATYPCAVCGDQVTDELLDRGEHACCACGWRDRTQDGMTGGWRCTDCDPLDLVVTTVRSGERYRLLVDRARSYTFLLDRDLLVPHVVVYSDSATLGAWQLVRFGDDGANGRLTPAGIRAFMSEGNF